MDFESAQERAHINAFKEIAEKTELELFNERVFTFPMKYFASETMIYQNTNWFKEQWKKILINSYTLLSTGNAFLASQYLTIRGLRTLKGKIIQHQLSKYFINHPNQDLAPIPSKISYHHFLDESYHFNSSTIIGLELSQELRAPTKFEKIIVNKAIEGCQKDHRYFNNVVNGIFWYTPAIYHTVLKVLQGPVFSLSQKDSIILMKKSFCEENDGLSLAHKSHQITIDNYIEYVKDVDFINSKNKQMSILKKSSNLDFILKENKKEFNKFQGAL